MFDEKDVRELAAFHADGATVLSLYLSTDPSRHVKDEVKLSLRGMLKQAVALGAAQADADRMDRFVELEYDWQAKGLAMFSCQAQDFWRALPVSVPVSNHVFVADRPYVKPLSDMLDEYGRFAVALVDQEGARVILYHLGIVEDTAGTFGTELKRHKKGGWAAQRLQRRQDEKAHQNLKDAVTLVKDFCNKHRCKRLIAGGQEETVSRFLSMLPKALRDSVIGTMPIDITASESEALARAQDLLEKAERDREAALIQQMITAATKGGPGAIGLADTLTALQEERVHILLVEEGFQATAFRCDHCGYIGAQKTKTCVYCGGPMVPVKDAVDAIVRRAIRRGVEIEFVQGNEDLKRAGQIGAILRY
ncbi:MAG: Vms1/Ankzf1 family peptidyl-tRNA hydrolase [Anaerolineae bacterium]|nr:Vms1/Ankzf1 family peptidyl-tRNA hydrolase [Anaerolineae bacterium]